MWINVCGRQNNEPSKMSMSYNLQNLWLLGYLTEIKVTNENKIANQMTLERLSWIIQVGPI